MNYMLAISLAAALTGFVLCVRRRMEETLPPFICGLMLLLYGLSVFQALDLMHVIAPAAAVVLCAAGVWRSARKPVSKTLGLIFTPGMLCFAAVSVFLVWCSRECEVHATDDIYYWSVHAHAVFAHGGLTDAARHLAPRFMTYTPGMQLWQWIGLTVYGEWSEPVMFAMLWIFRVVFLVPLMSGITWKKAYWVPLAAVLMVCVPTLTNVDAYNMLRVDTSLGVCMGYALVQAYSLWRNEKAGFLELSCFAAALCALVMVKLIGIAWAVMAMAFVWLMFSPKNGLKRGHLALACAAPLAVFASWQAVCAAFELRGVHVDSASRQLRQMIDGTWKSPEWLGKLPAATWKAMTSDFNGGLPMLVLLVLLGAALWILSGSAVQKRRLRGWCIGAIAVFVVAYMAILVTSIFTSELDGIDNARFLSELTQRYGCPLPMGLLMLTAAWLLDGSFPHKKLPRRALTAAMLVLVLGAARWGIMGEAFIPSVYAEKDDDLSYETELSENFWIDELEGQEPGIILYGTEYPPYIAERLQYVAAPHKIIPVSGYDMSEEDFLKLLEEKHITHIVCMDDMNAVYENAVRYTEDEWLDVCTVYTVNHEDGQWQIAY